MSFRRTAARDGNQVRFLPAAQLALPARPRPVVDGGFESLIDEPSPRSGDSEGAYRNRLSRLAVRQPFVSFQQRKGPLYRAGQRLAPAGYLNQIGPLGWCQFDFVLYGRHIRVRPPWKIIPKPTQSHILYQHFMEPVLGQEEYNQLQQEIRASPVVYGDETGWREAGRNGYLWSFSNPEVRYFLRRGSRGSKVVAEVLGDEFDGVLVSGFYGAYNVHQGLHQRCWTHLLRDIHQLKEKYPQHQGLAQWAQQVREVYDHAQAGPGPDPELPETVQRAQRVKLQQQCQQRLWSICKPYLGSDAPMSVLCQRVERFLPELFTFVAEPRAKADNHAAERSLRPTVVSRKISGGTRSPEGSNTKSVLASLFGTWRLRGRNPYQALNSILAQPQLAPV